MIPTANLILISVSIISAILLWQAHSRALKNLENLPPKSMFFKSMNKIEYQTNIAKIIFTGWTIFYILYTLNKFI